MPEENELKTIRVAKAFEVTLDDGRKVFVPVGVQAVEAAVADHWYTKPHLEQQPAPALGDFEYAQALRAAADARRAEAEAAEAQAVEAEEAFAAKNAEALAAAKAKSVSTLPADPLTGGAPPVEAKPVRQRAVTKPA